VILEMNEGISFAKSTRDAVAFLRPDDLPIELRVLGGAQVKDSRLEVELQAELQFTRRVNGT
jgi:hypothetical protein